MSIPPICSLKAMLGFGSTELPRRSDRVERMVLVTALALVPAAPVAAVTAGQVAHRHVAAVAAGRAETAYRTEATAAQPALFAASWGGGSPKAVPVQASWRAPDGTLRTGRIAVVPGSRAGQRVPMWVDQTG